MTEIKYSRTILGNTVSQSHCCFQYTARKINRKKKVRQPELPIFENGPKRRFPNLLLDA